MDPSIDIHTRPVVIYHNPNEITTGMNPDLGNTNKKRKKRFRIPNFDRKNETSGHDINLNQMKFSESLNSADLQAFSKIGSWTPYIFWGFSLSVPNSLRLGRVQQSRMELPQKTKTYGKKYLG